MTNRLDEAVRFFENLYDEDDGMSVKLATASMTDRGKRTQKWHDPNMRLRLTPGEPEMVMGRLERFIVRSDRGEEIFYAPTPMSGKSGRKKEQALPSRVVFGDADNGLTDEARARLIELDATLVLSGGTTAAGKPKYHVYIRLSRAVPPAELERLNRGLKTLIAGDKFDCTTVLRVPGTVNHKYPGKPLVAIERLSRTRQHPDNVAKFLAVPDDASHTAGVVQTPANLPNIPEGFDPKRREYWRVRNTVRNWNSRFESGECHRYMAAIAIVKDAIKSGLSMDVAYAFAETCEPLLDKQAEENGYTIRKDIAKIWRRETAAPPSGTLTADDILSTPQHEDAKRKSTAEPVAEAVVPKAFQSQGEGPNPYSHTDSRTYVDMSILTSGNFKPPEPEFFPVADFHLLYRGHTHCVFGDSGSGKTWIVLAQVAAELKAGRRVKFIDFENGAMTIGHRLHNVLGVPAELLGPETFRYMFFSTMPDEAEISDEAEEGHDLVIIDGVDASLAMFQKAMNSATEVRQWYDEFPQKFANQGSTVVLIDHTSKGNRDKVPPRLQEPGGTPAKLAVLTGAAFFVVPAEGRELVPGRRGVVEAWVTRKDKEGFLKSKATKEGHLFNFIIDTVQGETVIEFEGVKEMSEPANTSTQPSHSEKLSDIETRVLSTLENAARPVAKGDLRKMVGANANDVAQAVDTLAERGMVDVQKQGRAIMVILLSPTPPTAPAPGGARSFDFSNVKDRPRSGPKRECRKCGEMEHLLRPDDIGYDPKRPMCRPCADESIDAETQWALDGPGRARRIRENTDRRRRTREDD